jgi:DNA gyrase/topoisomerase IV subunit B
MVCAPGHDRGTEEKVKEFLHRGGITEFVKLLTEGKEKLHPDVEVITALGEKNGVGVEVAMRWSKDQYDDLLIGFANGIRTGTPAPSCHLYSMALFGSHERNVSSYSRPSFVMDVILN